MNKTEELLKKLKLNYKNIDLYDLALTHSSYRNDLGLNQDYERLEFMGDAALSFVIAELAYELRKDLDQGGLTKLRISLVQSANFIKEAKKLGLHEYVKLGKGLQNESMVHHERILEDVFEAFSGAIYLDNDFDYFRGYVANIFSKSILDYKLEDATDYKSRLQEEMQSEYRKTVTYRVIEETGPSHDLTFKVEVLFNNMVLGIGEGKSKKEAEQKAAKAALDKKAV